MSEIYFNLDLTLTEMEKSFDECFVEALKDLDVPDEKIDPESYSDIFFEFFEEMEPEPRKKAFEKYFEEKDIGASPERASEIYIQEELKAVKPVEDLRQNLEKLSQDFTLGVVTAGTTDLQKKKIEKLGIDKLLADVFITYEQGSGKKEILYKLQEDSIYFSNSDSDVEKAKEAGIKSIKSDFKSAKKIRSEVKKVE